MGEKTNVATDAPSPEEIADLYVYARKIADGRVHASSFVAIEDCDRAEIVLALLAERDALLKVEEELRAHASNRRAYPSAPLVALDALDALRGGK